MSSLVAVVGIWLARAGVSPLFDPIAGMAVAGMIFHTGLTMLAGSVEQLTDTVDPALLDRIAANVERVPGVRRASNIRTRNIGSETHVDLLVTCVGDPTASAAAQISAQAQRAVLEVEPSTSDCVVAIRPDDKPCPLIGALPGPPAVEAKVRAAVAASVGVTDVPSVIVRYSKMQPQVDVTIAVSIRCTVAQASRIAADARADAERANPGVDVRPIQLQLPPPLWS